MNIYLGNFDRSIIKRAPNSLILERLIMKAKWTKWVDFKKHLGAAKTAKPIDPLQIFTDLVIESGKE